MVEGAPRPHQNPFCYSGGVRKHSIGRNAEDLETLLLQPRIPGTIPLGARLVMGGAVDLGHRARFPAVEVDDVGIDRVLAPKLKSIGLAAKVLPEEDLGQRHFLPKPARLVDCRAP
jgi:hypothetical protein